MQFLRLFLTALLAVLGAGVVLFFGGRELFVFLARWNMNSDINEIKSLKQYPKTYFQQCTEEFSRFGSESSLAGFQIRFLDNKNYQIEAVCTYDTTQPITIQSKSLPFYATKLPGSSGFFVKMTSFAPSSIQLDIFGRKTTIALSPADGELIDEAQVYPQTQCVGWGYQCCDVDAEVTSEDVVGTGALDCPGTCSSVCKKKPVVFSFNAEPSFNSVARSVNIVSGTPVEFAYVFGDSDGTVDTATIDFGDGSRSEIPVKSGNGTIEHTYVCSSSQCSFVARLSLTDNDGLSSNVNSTSTLRVYIRSN